MIMHTQENENGMSVPTVPSTCKGFAPSLNSGFSIEEEGGMDAQGCVRIVIGTTVT